MKTPTDTVTQTPEDILNELRALVIEAEKILGHDSSAIHTDSTIAALRERLEAAQERLTAVYDRARRKVESGAREADAVIRSHPYQSLAVAVGVGLLAGVLLGRRSK